MKPAVVLAALGKLDGKEAADEDPSSGCRRRASTTRSRSSAPGRGRQGRRRRSDRSPEGRARRAEARWSTCAAIAGLDGIKQLGTPGELVLGPLVTLAQIAAQPGRARALAGARRGVRARGHAADPQHGDHRRQPGAAAALLVLPLGRLPLQEEGRRDLLRASTARTSSTPSSATRCAPSCIRRASATALVAYRATVTLKGKKGERVVPLEEFFAPPEKDVTRENVLAPDELIAQVRCRRRSAATRAAYHKQVEKESFDWPMADVAVVLRMDGRTCTQASIVLGAAAPVPWRAQARRRRCSTGRVVDERAAEAAANAAMQGMTPLAQNALQGAGVPRRDPADHPRRRRRCVDDRARRQAARLPHAAHQDLVRRRRRVEARRIADRGLLVPGDDGGVRRRRRLLPCARVREAGAPASSRVPRTKRREG